MIVSAALTVSRAEGLVHLAAIGERRTRGGFCAVQILGMDGLPWALRTLTRAELRRLRELLLVDALLRPLDPRREAHALHAAGGEPS